MAFENDPDFRQQILDDLGEHVALETELERAHDISWTPEQRDAAREEHIQFLKEQFDAQAADPFCPDYIKQRDETVDSYIKSCDYDHPLEKVFMEEKENGEAAFKYTTGGSEHGGYFSTPYPNESPINMGIDTTEVLHESLVTHPGGTVLEGPIANWEVEDTGDIYPGGGRQTIDAQALNPVMSTDHTYNPSSGQVDVGFGSSTDSSSGDGSGSDGGDE